MPAIAAYSFFMIVFFYGCSICQAQELQREQGSSVAAKTYPAIETSATSEDSTSFGDGQLSQDAGLPKKRADSSTSPVRRKIIEEKMQQIDTIKQTKPFENQAIESFQKGEALYREGKTKEANKEWMKAIELSKDPDWMKRTIKDTKQRAASDLKQKKLIAKEEKKRKALEEKQRKKFDKLRKKEEKRQKKLINFNKVKEQKFFALDKKHANKNMPNFSKPVKFNKKSMLAQPKQLGR